MNVPYFWISVLQKKLENRRKKPLASIDTYKYKGDKNRYENLNFCVFEYVSSIIRNNNIEKKLDTNLFIGTIFDRFVTWFLNIIYWMNSVWINVWSRMYSRMLLHETEIDSNRSEIEFFGTQNA